MSAFAVYPADMTQGYGPPGGQDPSPYQYPYPGGHPGAYPAPPQQGPTSDERSMAILAHVLSIFSSFVAPLIIYLMKRKESRFVGFHALQALVWHVGFMVAWFGISIAFLVAMVSGAVQFPGPPRAGAQGGVPFPPLSLGFFAVWFAMMLLWFVNIGFSVYLAIRSGTGKWSHYPLVGALVQRFGGYELDR